MNTIKKNNNLENTTSPFYITYSKQIFWLIVISVSMVFILPMICVFLSTAWPSVFPGKVAINYLKNAIVDTVGFMSLIVGIFSICYAFFSNKIFEKQKKQQDYFLDEINNKITTIISDVKNMRNENKSFYDTFKNVETQNPKNKTNTGGEL